MKDMDLLCFFRPSDVAVINPNFDLREHRNLLENLLGSSTDPANIYIVSPEGNHKSVRKVYNSVKEIGKSPDLAVIFSDNNGDILPTAIWECAEAGVKGLIIMGNESLSADFFRRQKDLDIKIMGPGNCAIITPYSNISCLKIKQPKPGKIALISDSPSVVRSLIDWSMSKGFGFTGIVVCGSKYGIDETDFITFFGNDPETSVILVYSEYIRDGMKFFRRVPPIARKKPVIIFKPGNSEFGKRALSTRGIFPGDEGTYHLAFKKCGVITPKTFGDLFMLAEFFSKIEIPSERKGFIIITNGGGPGIVAADAFGKEGIPLSPIPADTLNPIMESLPSDIVPYNPLDIRKDADPKRYAAILEKILSLPSDICSGAVVIVNPGEYIDPEPIARILIEMKSKFPDKIILPIIPGGDFFEHILNTLNEEKFPVFRFPEDAVNMLGYLYRFITISGTPDPNTLKIPRFRVSTKRASDILHEVFKDGRYVLLPTECSELLDMYGINNPGVLIAKSVEDALAAAEKIGYPVVMKVVSPDITDKFDIGGVITDISNEEEVIDAFHKIMYNTSRFGPDNARIVGIAVQKMIDYKSRRKVNEILVNITRDPIWGPVIDIGMGGIYAGFIRDSARELCYKYTREIARQHLSKTEIYRILEGVRGEPKSDIDALVDVLIRIIQMVNDLPEIVDLNINPLLVFEETPEHDGYCAVDVKITVNPRSGLADIP